MTLNWICIKIEQLLSTIPIFYISYIYLYISFKECNKTSQYYTNFVLCLFFICVKKTIAFRIRNILKMKLFYMIFILLINLRLYCKYILNKESIITKVFIHLFLKFLTANF